MLVVILLLKSPFQYKFKLREQRTVSSSLYRKKFRSAKQRRTEYHITVLDAVQHACNCYLSNYRNFASVIDLFWSGAEGAILFYSILFCSNVSFCFHF